MVLGVGCPKDAGLLEAPSENVGGVHLIISVLSLVSLVAVHLEGPREDCSCVVKSLHRNYQGDLPSDSHWLVYEEVPAVSRWLPLDQSELLVVDVAGQPEPSTTVDDLVVG